MAHSSTVEDSWDIEGLGRRFTRYPGTALQRVDRRAQTRTLSRNFTSDNDRGQALTRGDALDDFVK